MMDPNVDRPPFGTETRNALIPANQNWSRQSGHETKSTGSRLEGMTYARVQEAFYDLLPSPPFNSGAVMASVVRKNAGIGNIFLFRREPAHLRGRSQQEQAQCSGDDRHGAQKVRHIPPRLKARAALVLDGANSVQDQAGDDAKPCVGTLEDQSARSVLSSRVPRADDEDEPGTDAAFEETLERPESDELREVLGEADAEDHDAPAEHVEGQCPSHFVSLKDNV